MRLWRCLGIACAALAVGCSAEGPAVESEPETRSEGEMAIAETSRPAPAAPRVRVLGTAQDGGLPHAACDCRNCERARRDPAGKRLVAGLAVLLPDPRRVWLIDATPDIREQLHAVRDWRGGGGGRVDRSPVDGILLTHAHIGHYTGLSFFGFEAIHSSELPVYGTASMASFLETNGPWSQLVRIGNIRLREIAPGRPIELGQGVTVEPLSVPHRDEYAETVGFLIRGPRRSVLYVPDTDSWRAWDPPLARVLDGVDVALLDGTFFSADELSGRSVDSIGHPLIVDSMDLLESRTDRLEVYFTHLNHSNPALDPDGPERARLLARGFHLAAERMEIPL